MNVSVFRVYRRGVLRSLVGILFFGMVFAFAYSSPAEAVAGINQQINFQGRLLNASGVPVADGNYNIQFKLYQDGTGTAAGNPGGTLKWTENYLNASGQGVTIKNGYVSVQLGSINPFGTQVDWNQDTLWLSINVGNTNASCTPFTSCAPDGEMLPMKQLGSTPFSLNSQMLQGKTAADFIQNTTVLQQGNLAIQSSNAGNVGMLIQGAFAQTSDIFQVKGNGATTPYLSVGSSGAVNIQPSSDTLAALTIKSSLGNNAFTVDTGNARVGIGLGGNNQPGLSGAGLEIQGALRLSAGTGDPVGYTDSYLTPAGSTVPTKISIPAYDPGNYGQIIAMGVPSSANSTARVMSLFDARTTAHQPTIGVFSPNEDQIFGFSWDGTNDTGFVKNTASKIALQGGGVNIITAINNGGVANVGIGNNGTAGYALDVTGDINASTQYRIGGVAALTNSSLTFSGSSAAKTITAGTTGAGMPAKSLSITAGSANASGAAVQGGALSLQGGNAAGTGDASGGDVALAGGTGTGAGVNGLVTMGAGAYSSGTHPLCATNCTIGQSLVDTYGTIIVSSSDPDVIITLPAPTRSTAGRLLYVTTTSTSADFTLDANAGANHLSVTMKANTTATMIWNGTAWTPGGASNAITLQATYNNGTNPVEVPEIKLDGIRKGLDIQDADTSIGSGEDIFTIRGSNNGLGGLGTKLFGVDTNGRVTIQGTTDQSSSFGVKNASGNYLFNINSNNNYVISNSTQSLGNAIQNPGFESGGLIDNSEEGWTGPATAAFQTLSPHTGKYGLQISPTGTTQDTYAANYFEVAEGTDIYAEAWVRSTGGTTGSSGIRVTWYDANKAILSSVTDSAAPTTTWTLRKIAATAPASTMYMRLSATTASGTGMHYFDDFYLKKNTETAAYTFRNSNDSAAAFRIQSAGAGQTLFTANTSNNTVKIGDSTGSNTATTIFVLDSTTIDPTTVSGKDGGLFYNSANGSLKTIINGAVVDVCTTAVTCAGYSASAGSSIQLQASTPGSTQVGHFNISGTGILANLKSHDSSVGNGESLSVKAGSSTATGATGGNLVLDAGNGPGGKGTITVGSAGVNTTMGGNVEIQGSSLALGISGTATGSVTFKAAAGNNTVTLRAPLSNPTNAAGSPSDYTLSLPSQMGSGGECMKTDATGNMYFQNCGVGANVNLQDVYNNSGSPATINTADSKDIRFNATDTVNQDANIIMDLQCTNSCGANGRFAIQNAGVDVLTVSPQSGNITMRGDVQIGSATTNATMHKLQLDSYSGNEVDPSTGNTIINCSNTVNQGALYYNTTMGSIRGCVNGTWSDISNPDTLGLLTFGIIPSSGGPNNAYDLPSLIQSGSSGPCKVSRTQNDEVTINACVAYTAGRRANVSNKVLCINKTTTTTGASCESITLTGTNRWAHVCVNPSTNQASFYSHSDNTGAANATDELPAFDTTKPVLCLADIQWVTSGSGIDNLYDVRTFSSALKEAVNTSAAVELGMLVDAGTTGAMQPATSASAKLYGTVVVADSNTLTSAGAPNAIVTTVGPAWVKANAGTQGQFVITSTTNGYARTNISIPNNSFYYSAGNTRTNYDTTCTTSSNCSGSLYVNFIVR